jgi:hypothetical protein
MPVKAPPPAPPPAAWGFLIDGSIDGVYAHRNSAVGTLVRPIAGPGSIIDAQDFPFKDDKSAYDARLRVGYGPVSVEGRYLAGLNWKSQVPNLGAVGNVQIGSFSNFGATNLNAAANSKFDSREANLRWQPVKWLTAFVGYRRIKMSDRTDLNITFPAFTALYRFEVPWRAQGPQVGAEVRLFGPGTTWQPGPFFADVDARIGFMSVKANTVFALLPSTGGLFTGGAAFSSKSTMYELGATLGYRILPNWEVRAGYRFISIEDGLTANDYAIAATSQSSQNIVPGTRRLDMHMGTIGTRVMFP